MRILYVTSTRIGDAVLASGVLAELLRRYPDARVTVAAGPAAAPLFRALPNLERLIAVGKKPYHRHWLELWAQVAPRRWDLVVDLRGSGLAYCLWARDRRVGRGKGDPERHAVREAADLLQLDPPPAPTVWLSDADRARAGALIPEGGPVLALGPAANWRGKQWRAQRFAELAHRLSGAAGPLAGARVAVLAAESEREQAQPVLQAIPAARRIDLVGAVDLPQAAACLGRCRLFVGNDSGLMHLAAAAGAPTLGLFGPSRHQRYRPWSQHSAYVRTPESLAELTGSPDYDHRTTDTLMDGLSVEAVERAARDLLDATAAAESGG